MDRLQLRALAKINLGLDVLRRREDGYHEVRMIMQTIRLFDQIVLEKKNDPGIKVQTNRFYLPTDSNNLVYKAADLMQKEYDLDGGISIQLKKFIPVAAGMAGGSSDAAAVLVGMNRMYRLNLPQERLMELGVRIGADVPYCVMRGTALAEGIGEKLTPLPPMPDCHILIAKPAVSVSTKYVYENLHANELTEHPDIDGMLAALEAGDLKGITDRMQGGNVLERVTSAAHPEILKLEQFMYEQGAQGAMMSGSGPTVFGIFDNQTTARAAYEKLKKKNLAKQCYLTIPYNNRRSV